MSYQDKVDTAFQDSVIKDTINEYATRAKSLKKQLAEFGQFKHFREDNCKHYLELSSEYTFLTKMFSDMNLFHWSDDDFEI